MQLQRFYQGEPMPMKPYKPRDDIKKLKELTGQFARDVNVKHFQVIDGRKVVVRNLMNRDAIAVVDSGIPKGGVFPRHNHDVFEWLIVYTGRAEVDIGDDKYTIGPDETMKYVILPPGTSHEVTALEDVRLVAVTMPAEEGFPGGSGR